ncbi:MAG: endolytic transglycosylase MltG [Candidatus Binatia bacterium]
MKRAFVLVLVLAIVGGLVARHAFEVFLERPGPPLAAPIRIDVAPGEPFRTTAEKLEDAGLVRNSLILALWARWRGIDRFIQHGAYQFTESLPPVALVEKMRTGEAMVLRVTLPEGGTAYDLVTALEREGLGRADQFLSLARSRDFARSLGVAADGLEGYLFPDTYFFSPLYDPEKIMRTFVARFQAVFTPEMAAEAERLGFSVHQIVTLASVIEKETARAEERPLIAAVFRNRLRLGIPLQADPTVIYGIENFNGNLTRKDLETRTPYNTYTEIGLPPGPIANPGRHSLLAALRPADAPYLYFVAREDGSHEFNSNLADHNRAVNRHQRSHRTRPRAG